VCYDVVCQSQESSDDLLTFHEVMSHLVEAQEELIEEHRCVVQVRYKLTVDRQTDRLTDRQTDRQAHRHTDRQVCTPSCNRNTLDFGTSTDHL
jgi:hypothetical protein